ncbi:MAG: ion channel [Cyanobacteriota bacterium]|jgi:voltage-gated potassium channel
MALSAGRWSRIERQFIPLMIATLLPILLMPSTASGDPRDRWILFGLLALIIIQSLRSLPAISPGRSSQLWLLAYRFVAAVAMVGTFAFIHFGEAATLAFKAMLLPDALFFVMTCVRLALLLARVPRVNGQVMAGATAGYLLLGLTGGLLATTTQAFAPGAFLLGGEVSHQMVLDRLTYYSFITLGGLGYGDVLPGNVFGERFAILLSITGTLYVALLVGLLLGRFIASEEVRFLELEEEKGGGEGESQP